MATMVTLGGLEVAVQAQNQKMPKSKPVAEVGSQPLVVPIFPRFNSDVAPTDVQSLKDSYIVMDDGAVISLADWVLGSLNKNNTGAGMSDYQSRLFLGQVARAVAGLKQDLIYRSFQDPGPTRPFVPHHPPAPVQAVQGILAMFVPALAPGWTPQIPEPALSDVANRGNGGTIQFDKQFSKAVQLSSEDFVYEGRLRNILSDFESTRLEAN